MIYISHQEWGGRWLCKQQTPMIDDVQGKRFRERVRNEREESKIWKLEHGKERAFRHGEAVTGQRTQLCYQLSPSAKEGSEMIYVSIETELCLIRLDEISTPCPSQAVTIEQRHLGSQISPLHVPAEPLKSHHLSTIYFRKSPSLLYSLCPLRNWPIFTARDWDWILYLELTIPFTELKGKILRKGKEWWKEIHEENVKLVKVEEEGEKVENSTPKKKTVVNSR